MLKKFSYSIISLSIFATSLNFIDTQAQASSSSVSEKGTMGYGYQQYLKDHPDINISYNAFLETLRRIKWSFKKRPRSLSKPIY